MNKLLLATMLAAVALSPVVIKPQQLLAAVPQASSVTTAGTPMLVADWRANMIRNWNGDAAFGTVEPSADGLKLTTVQQPPHIYSLQARLLNQIPVAKGDTLFIRFAARSLQADKATGVTKLRLNFAKSSPNWDSSYQGEIGLTSDWQRYDIPFTCKNDFAVGEAMIAFTFGFPAQQAEIADLTVQRFNPDILPASLPKTKRFADKVAPEVVQDALNRIVALKAELAEVSDPSPANGKIIHVAKTGMAAGNGSVERPFATIPQALAVVKPGDTIEVGAGEYIEPRGISIRTSGRPDAWIHLKAAAGTRPKIVTSNWSGIDIRGGMGYVEIEGFELEWVPNAELAASSPNAIHGSGIAAAYATHHIRVLNNVVHGYGTGGIVSLDCDYMHVEGNVVYNTAKTSPYGGSAISLCRSFNFDEYAGYHNVVRGNICYDNELKVVVLETSGGTGRTLTDGNGIIIDVFDRSRANPLKPHHEDRDGALLPYRHRTLVENNLIYDNGGRGVHIFRSSKVDVINNTTYMNQKSPDINAGELSAVESNEVVFANNIAYGRREKRGNTQDGSRRVIWTNNLFYNADDVLIHDGLIQADPQFVAPAAQAKPIAFDLKTDSPARGKAILSIAPPVSLSGKARPADEPANLGAF